MKNAGSICYLQTAMATSQHSHVQQQLCMHKDRQANTSCHEVPTIPVTTCCQFCINITSARSIRVISMEDRKSASSPPMLDPERARGFPPPALLPSSAKAVSASLVASAMGEATTMSDCESSANSLTAPRVSLIPNLHSHNNLGFRAGGFSI